MTTNIFSSLDPDSIGQAIKKDNDIRQALFTSLEVNKDYFVTTVEMYGPRNVLKKSGAEVIANHLGIKVSMSELETLQVAQGGIIYTAKAFAKIDNEIVAEGISSRSSLIDNGDVNTTAKMMYKSAFIDVVLRATGMTRHFTQDIPESSDATGLEQAIKTNDHEFNDLLDRVKDSLGIRLPFVLAQRKASKPEDLSYSELLEIAEDEFIDCSVDTIKQHTEEEEDLNKHNEELPITLNFSNSRTATAGLTL